MKVFLRAEFRVEFQKVVIADNGEATENARGIAFVVVRTVG